MQVNSVSGTLNGITFHYSTKHRSADFSDTVQAVDMMTAATCGLLKELKGYCTSVQVIAVVDLSLLLHFNQTAVPGEVAVIS
jgi:hypothetical protein